MVLDYVRVFRFYLCHEGTYQLGLRGITLTARLQHLRCTRWVAHCDHEDPVVLGIESGGFQVELHAA